MLFRSNPVHGGLYLSQKSIANNVNINDGMVQLISGAQLENTNLSNHSMLDMHNTGQSINITAKNSELYVYHGSTLDKLTAKDDVMMVSGHINHGSIEYSLMYLGGQGQLSNTHLNNSDVVINGDKTSFNHVKGNATLIMQTNLVNGKTDKLNIHDQLRADYKIDIIPQGEDGVNTKGQGIQIIKFNSSVNMKDPILAHRVTAGILEYKLNNQPTGLYLKTVLNSTNEVNGVIPEATSNYAIATLNGVNNQLSHHKTLWVVLPIRCCE